MKKLNLVSVLFCLSAFFLAAEFSQIVFASPAQLVILRHAEKPTSGNTLSPRGYERANALVGFFKDNSIVNAFGAPVAIYAAGPESEGKSIRPIETVTPLAKNLSLSIHTQFTKADYGDLIREVLNSPTYDGKTVVICWVRNTLIDLLQGFGVTNGPSEWPEDLFDRALILNFSGSALVNYRNIPQHLLPRDSDTF